MRSWRWRISPRHDGVASRCRCRRSPSAASAASLISSRSFCSSAPRRPGRERARPRWRLSAVARAGGEITVAEVMAAVEEETHLTRCHDEATARLLWRVSAASRTALWHGLERRHGRVSSERDAGRRLSTAVCRQRRGERCGRTSWRAVRLTPRRVYLDYNATAPLRPEARAAMIAALDVTGNPSSVHAEGRRARGIVETAREQVAALVGAKPSEVVFTSGATEANAWAIAQPADTILLCRHRARLGAGPARASQRRASIELPRTTRRRGAHRRSRAPAG